MKFPNAYKGIGHIRTSWILGLIGMAILAFIMIATAAGAMNREALAEAGNAVPAAILGVSVLLGVIALLILALISMILRVLGIVEAKRDEAAFGTALTVTVLSLVFMAANVLLPEGILRTVLSFVYRGCSLLSAYYIMNAVITLAERLKNRAVGEAGKKAVLCYAIGQVLGFGTDLVKGTASIALTVVSTAVILIGSVLFVRVLSSAMDMLKKK